MTKTYREGLPPLPRSMERLPVDHRGYPVPWFVFGKDQEGKWDFRVADRDKRQLATNRRLCWVCGDSIRTRELTFVIGPMCAITRSTSEPAVHAECAEFSVQACPFMLLPKAQYRDANLPAGWKNAPGAPLGRNPGVSCVWVTHSFRTFRAGDLMTQRPGQAGGDFLIEVGMPVAVLWMAQGRAATRAEVLESIDGGYPSLEAAARSDPDPDAALWELERQKQYAMTWLPREPVAL